VPVSPTPNVFDDLKGNVRMPSPIIGLDQDGDVYLTVTNIGLVIRPDLDDSHTVHWHGFPNATSIFDGVPEVSIAVPVGRSFPYFYHPRREGTFMYHCHFEDVEHVQMGMDGVVCVRPRQNRLGAAGAPIAWLGGNLSSTVQGYAYNDGVAVTDPRSTAYDREFCLLLNEIWTTPHDNLQAIQESVWTDYDANYWVINGRAYPDTIKLEDDPSLELDGRIRQPVSSLIQVNPGDRVLLRFANLGYEQHAMQLTGIPMKVVGEDATPLSKPGGADLSYMTNTIYIGPGEARDVLFRAPAFTTLVPTASDAVGTYNRYVLKNRNYQKLTNNGLPGPGGMLTEVRVYSGSPLPIRQLRPNQTYPPLV
jgi:FtsP/CotA-like multicopper oxidase with cupredoxin domain